VRFVDDFALFSDDHSYLTEARIALEDYLAGLRLQIHPVKSQLFETSHGATFLGFRIYPNQIRVRRENLHRARHRLKQLQSDYASGKISLNQVIQCLQSWEAHLKHGTTWRLRQQIFTSLVFSRE
jgi:retron-type reverse transcriptase